jgi:hypothetical protein
MRPLAVPALTALVLTVPLAGCGSVHKNNRTTGGDGSGDALAAPTGAFLSATDLQPTSPLKDVSVDDLDDFMGTTDQFYSVPPADGDDSSEADNPPGCNDALFKQLVYHATDTVVTVSGAIDLSPCLQSSDPGTGTGGATDTGATLSGTMTIKVYGTFTCPGGGLAELDGTPVLSDASDSTSIFTAVSSHFSGTNLCQGSTAGILLNAATNFDISGSLLGIAFHSAGKTLDAIMGANGSPCDITLGSASRTFDDQCVDLERTTMTTSSANGQTTPDQGTDDIQYVAYHGIVETTDGNPWFVSGELEVTKDAWTGTVTYAPQGAPTWSMTNGTDTETGMLTMDPDGGGGSESSSKSSPVIQPQLRLVGKIGKIGKTGIAARWWPRPGR